MINDQIKVSISATDRRGHFGKHLEQKLELNESKLYKEFGRNRMLND